MSELKPRQTEFNELAQQFSRFIDRLNHHADSAVATIAGLLSDAVSQGHVCLNLDHIIGPNFGFCDNKEDLITRLKKSHVVGASGDYKPLILTDDGLLYLYRYWQDEQYVAKEIKQRCKQIEIFKPEQLQQDFAQWKNNREDLDWQKVAVFMALTRQFCVISGGPGTGKTTIVLRLLQMLHSQHSELNIALAAPTGKAAARLQQAIIDNGNSSLQAKTVHRLLGITANNDKGRYSQQHPLPVDVLIVDEASMIDISLMAKLMQALPENARLILLGDSQQLASVESGAVLANLCDTTLQFTDKFTDDLTHYTGMELTPTEGFTSMLADSVVILQHSYRFDQKSDIGQLAKAVQAGDVQTVYSVIADSERPLWQQQLEPSHILYHVFEQYHAYFDTVLSNQDAMFCLQVFEQYQVLCALKQGPHSVASVNALIERQLQKQGWKTHQSFYHGRPIMVTQNDYRQGLFNGDTGLILADEKGHLRACFKVDNTVRWVELSRLPSHETVFAMTIHKSQGSEFDSVSVLLPEEESNLLNRELLYTAITRAKKHVALLSSEMILAKTIVSKHQRESGLAGLLET